MRQGLQLGLYLVTDERLSRGAPDGGDRARGDPGRGRCGAVARQGAADPRASWRSGGRCGRSHARRASSSSSTDRVDLALALDADGVHVGQDDLPADVVRRPRRSGRGLSGCRRRRSRRRGPRATMARTTSASARSGGPRRRPTRARRSGRGLIASLKRGGRATDGRDRRIKAGNAAEVIAAGGDGVAVVSGIVSADDPEAAARDLKARIVAARR